MSRIRGFVCDACGDEQKGKAPRAAVTLFLPRGCGDPMLVSKCDGSSYFELCKSCADTIKVVLRLKGK